MRLAGWFAGITTLILVVWMIFGEGMETRFSLEGSVAYLEGAGSHAWLVAWALLVADVVLPVPGSVVMSALGWIYGALLGGVLSAAGSVMSGLVAYGACRLLGERGARFLLGPRDYERGKRWFVKGGGWLVCLSRSLPVLPEAIACTAGLLRMPFRVFVIALICGSLPMGMTFAWIGAQGKDDPVMALVLSLILPALLWMAARLLLRRMEKDHEQQ